MRLFNLPTLTNSLLLLFCLQICPVWGRVDTLRAFPEKRFVNGAMDFGQYLMTKLRYPLEAMQAGVVGTELVSVTIAPTGKLVNVAIVNSLGKAIDREVTRVIQETNKLWLPADQSASQDSIMLFIAVKFTLANRSGDKDFYVEAVKPDFLLNEIVVVGYGSINFDVRDDAYYINELSAASPKKDYKRMLRMVNELIRRNPYSDKLYLQRANIEQQLGQTDEACSDYKKIIYFLGRTSFPKKFLQNCPEFPTQGSSGSTLTQTTKRSPIEEEIFTVCEVPPSFPGGTTELDNYIRQNLRYPEAALNKKVQGKVFVSFIVTKDGNIQEVHPLRGIGFGADEEAVRLVENMPNWNPGNQSGRPVNVKYNLVIPFTLAEAK